RRHRNYQRCRGPFGFAQGRLFDCETASLREAVSSLRMTELVANWRDTPGGGTAPLKPKDGLSGPPSFPIWRRKPANLRVRPRAGAAQVLASGLWEELPKTAQELPTLQGSLRLRSGQALRLRNCFASRSSFLAQDDR